MYKKFSLAALVGLMSLAAVLLIIGCSDNKSTNPGNNTQNTLTAEEQFALLNPYLNNVNPDNPPVSGSASDVLGISPLSFGFGTVHGEFLSGVDLATVANIEIPGLNKGVPGAINPASISLDYVDGWWEIEIDSARTDAEGAKTVHYTGRVQFQDASGTAQNSPDETTVKYTEDGDFTSTFNKTDAQSSLNVTWVSHSSATINLNPLSGMATLNASASGSITGAYIADFGASTLALGYDGTTSNVMVSLVGPDQCPSTGSIGVNFNIQYDSSDADTTVDHVDADWTMNASVQQGGTAQITFQSGDFTRTVTEDLECGGGGN